MHYNCEFIGTQYTVYIVCQLGCPLYNCYFYEQRREYSFDLLFCFVSGWTVLQKDIDIFYKIINIRENKSRTIGNRSLAFEIGELRVENTDILTFDLESIVFGYLKEVIVYIKWILKVPAIVEIRSSGKL